MGRPAIYYIHPLVRVTVYAIATFALVVFVPTTVDTIIGTLSVSPQFARQTDIMATIIGLTYCLSDLVPLAIVYINQSGHILRGMETYAVDDERIRRICDRVANKMGMSPPQLLYTSEPQVFCYGMTGTKTRMVLYRGCGKLDDSALSAIMAHELSHAKNDLEWYTNLRIYKYRNKWLIPLTVLYGISLLGWISYVFWGNLAEILNIYEVLYSVILIMMPFAASAFVSSFIRLRRPVPEMDEFKADIAASVVVGSVYPVIQAIDSLTYFSITGLVSSGLKDHKEKKSFSETAHLWYDRSFRKGLYSKEKTHWLDYFKQSYSALTAKLGRGFDYPSDRIRKDFLLYLDRLMNTRIAFRYNSNAIHIAKIPVINKLIVINANDYVSNLSSLTTEINDKSFNDILNYIKGNSRSLNLRECAEATKVDLYNVILVTVYLIANGVLDEEKSCPNCHRIIKGDEKYCPGCGISLKQ